jgi:hypothetical protein
MAQECVKPQDVWKTGFSTVFGTYPFVHVRHIDLGLIFNLSNIVSDLLLVWERGYILFHIFVALGGITVDVLASVLTTIFIFINFSKVAWEPLWKFLLFSFLFCSGQARHVVLTFKYISKEYITHSDIVRPPSLVKMVKTASPLLSPSKPLEAKLLEVSL